MTQSEIEAAHDVAALVTAAQAGDRGALDELLATHLPVIYHVVGRALGGHADADDLVQDTPPRERNTWDGAEVRFETTDPTTAYGPRRPDGALPATTFLKRSPA